MGLTVMVFSVGEPTQKLAEGVTVITPEIPEAVALSAVKEGTFAEPEAPAPIAVFEFVQL
jgi:hypothetical protein